MKILYLMDYFKNPFAGTEGQLHVLIENLNKQGIYTELAVFQHSEYTQSGKFPSRVSNLNIKKMTHIMTLYRLVRLALYCKKEKIDLVHIYFNDASVIAPIILSLFGLKVLISRRDMGYWYSKNLLKILRFNSKFHHGCICNSDAVRQNTIEQEHIPKHLVHVVYNGIPENKIKDVNGTVDLHKIGIVANIRPIKRIEDLMMALKIVRKKISDASLVVVGGGDTSELIKLAQELDIEEGVSFLGAQSEVSSIINTFHVAVLCSESEGLSNSIMEYMAHKKPVICSKVGGNPELIENGVNGYLYPVGNVALLAEKLLDLLCHPDKAKEYGNNGFQKLVTQFSTKNMVDNTIAVYKRTLNKLP